ncbi:hypothetical protein Tco_0170119 [Tanacetum coccineum]
MDETRNPRKFRELYSSNNIRTLHDQVQRQWIKLLIVAKMKVIKEESELLRSLMIDDDFFTCDTPLGTIFNEFNRLSGIDDDLFTYEVGIPELSYFLSVKQQVDDLDDGDLYIYERKIDVTVKQWIDLKYGDHTMVSNEIMESVENVKWG